MRSIQAWWAHRLVEDVSIRQITRMLGAAVATTSLLLSTHIDIPAASAARCPDVEVVFARGTTEPPGVGGIGQAFVDSLRAHVGGRSVGVYAVNYPASTNFLAAADGVIDVRAHADWMA